MGRVRFGGRGERERENERVSERDRERGAKQQTLADTGFSGSKLRAYVFFVSSTFNTTVLRQLASAQLGFTHISTITHF